MGEPLYREISSTKIFPNPFVISSKNNLLYPSYSRKLDKEEC